MKPQYLAFTLAASLGSATAQSLPGLPACAQDCANGAIPSECSPVDVECICATRSFIVDMACCVEKSCEADDQQTAIDFANGICGGAGVTDLPQSATCAGDVTTTITSIATTAATDTTTETNISNDGPTTTTTEHTGTATTTISTASGISTTSKTSTSSLAMSGTPTSTETSADQAETDGAVLLQGKNVGVLAGIVAGVAFML
ncbi:CFEM domain-containing protein [Aspergillus mulundensis]|uniref:CFEM domain-containing protein n=1 Tax=Aspergillus mulundensis TaxID=1810919 RepID=A0A3D8Q6H7_9EURO|nr:hypothetical protein DSM5745_11520 [Aspergillus mulundensis]RDW57436.1 hypothetical protein DSM5745_11520 [Aspergillus mulundensis]